MSSSKNYPVRNLSQKSSKKPNRFRWLLMGVFFSGVAAFSATGGAILALYFYNTPFKKAQLTPKEEAVFNKQNDVTSSTLAVPRLDKPLNILVLGTKVLTSDLDSAPKDNKGYFAVVDSFEGYTDTMLLVRVDPIKQKLTVLSIPRDTKANIEGHGETKINAANPYGGPSLAAQSVSNLLNGVPIDRYVRVNIKGIAKLVDALGGVTIYIPYDMKYSDDSQHLYIDFKQGEQHLNGNKVSEYLRFRHDRYGDIGRVQRQQLLMRAIQEQALKPETLLQAPQLLSIIQDHIDSNLSIDELLALSGFMVKIKKNEVKMVMLPGNFNNDGKYAISYWLPDQEQIKKVMNEYFDVGYLLPSEEANVKSGELKIAIQDSTKNPEAVRALVAQLQKAGYRQVYVSDEWPQTLQKTKIVPQKGDDGSAAEIFATLGVGEVIVESTGALDSDVTIQLGQDWVDSYNQLHPESAIKKL